MEEPGPLGEAAIEETDSSAIRDVAREETAVDDMDSSAIRDVAYDREGRPMRTPEEPPTSSPDIKDVDSSAIRDVPEEPERKKPTPKKRGQPKQEKSQCPICLRWYCGKRVQPGGHVCHPIKLPEPKPLGTACRDEPKSPEPKSPEPKSPEPPLPTPPEEVLITHSDVVRFIARKRTNRHERKRDRWHQQMFG